MSTLHLGQGSEKPTDVEGQVRLYSMRYCPFSHRIRLILSLKKVPHNVVNINLKNKPDWYLQVHSDGKVPALVTEDGQVIVDSVAIANYLDETYPDSPLYNEAKKTRDLELLDQYSKITGIFSRAIHGEDSRPLFEIIAEISTALIEFENELKNRGTKFFGGETPGMLDILMWPWVERAKALPLIYKQSTNFNKSDFPTIMNWIANMKAQPFIIENACCYEEFARVIDAMKAGNVDYDNI